MLRYGLMLTALGLSACLDDSLRRRPDTAPPPVDLARCATDSECILIGISCNGCCQRGAVNRKDSLAYLDHKEKTCVGRMEYTCGCCHFPAKAVCDAGVCKYVELEENCATEPSGTDEEYVVVGRNPVSPDQKYFQAIEIHSGKATAILGIKETTGRTYFPMMSSLPECNKKVISGFVSSDTIFVTTKVLRDTTIPTVGR